MQFVLNNLESDIAAQTPSQIVWQVNTYRRNRKTRRLIDTRFGPVTIARWFCQNTLARQPGIAPLDLRLGLVAGRMTPAVAELAARLAADLPQQSVLKILQERFSIQPAVATLRKVIAEVASSVRVHHDDVPIVRLGELSQAGVLSRGLEKDESSGQRRAAAAELGRGFLSCLRVCIDTGPVAAGEPGQRGWIVGPEATGNPPHQTRWHLASDPQRGPAETASTLSICGLRFEASYGIMSGSGY